MPSAPLGKARPRIAILISGHGSNMTALAEAVRDGHLRADIAFVGSDRPDAPGLDAAARLGLETAVFPYSPPASKKSAEEVLLQKLKEAETDWLVLAGFMRILSPEFVQKWAGRIVNIHPSLLPSFPGAHAIEDALRYGVKVTGVTVHLVDEQVDHGPILAQSPVTVDEGENATTLATKIHAVEHRLYAEALGYLFLKSEEETR